MGYQPDKDRARRLREAQIRARDPGESKIPGYDWSKHDKKARRIAAQKKKEAERPLLLAIFEDLPARWKGLVYGFIFGTIIGVFIILLLPSDWRLLFVVPQLLCMVVGMILGKITQSDVKIR